MYTPPACARSKASSDGTSDGKRVPLSSGPRSNVGSARSAACGGVGPGEKGEGGGERVNVEALGEAKDGEVVVRGVNVKAAVEARRGAVREDDWRLEEDAVDVPVPAVTGLEATCRSVGRRLPLAAAYQVSIHPSFRRLQALIHRTERRTNVYAAFRTQFLPGLGIRERVRAPLLRFSLLRQLIPSHVHSPPTHACHATVNNLGPERLTSSHPQCPQFPVEHTRFLPDTTLSDGRFQLPDRFPPDAFRLRLFCLLSLPLLLLLLRCTWVKAMLDLRLVREGAEAVGAGCRVWLSSG